MAAAIRVQEAPFDTGAEIAALLAGRTDIGGIGCFVGVVRGGDGPDAVQEMTLEHYPAMTTRAIERVVAEAEARWPLLGCTVIHRAGTLRPGEPIVLVLAASAHRQPALDATAFLIDWLKTRAPFWKQERTGDGQVHWVEAHAADDEAAARWQTPSGG
jgi:molybdopterin synthase catalytic subunit